MTAFAHANGISFEDESARWAALSAQEKAKWEAIAKKKNKQEMLDRIIIRKRLLNYPILSPLRSFERKRIVNFEEIRRLLRVPRSKLVRKWRRDDIYKWAQKLDDPVPQYCPSEECIAMLETAYVPNDLCGTCRAGRSILLRGGKADPRERPPFFYRI